MTVWYQDGLRFSCQRSGKCCTGEPGNVWISEDEIHAMADQLGMDADSFRRRYTRKVYRRGVSLVELPNNDCVFFRKGAGCTLYESRPLQCRTWPFWRSLIDSQESWNEAAIDCPGMNQGTLHSRDEIETQAQNDGLPS